MSENMDSIAATLGKLAKALQEGTAGKGVDASSLKTMNDKLNLIINLLNRNVIVKLEKIEQYVDARAKELGIKIEVKPDEKPTTALTPPAKPEVPPASTAPSGDLPKPSIPAPTPSVKPPTAVMPPSSEPVLNQLKSQLGDLGRQITDLEFQFDSGCGDDGEYEQKKKELSEKRENVIKQIGIG
ncbi:MAG: hypothetical protein ACXACA_02160 [Candidatus Ranarchaeia archaeon]|jgi:hypothetical protein